MHRHRRSLRSLVLAASLALASGGVYAAMEMGSGMGLGDRGSAPGTGGGVVTNALLLNGGGNVSLNGGGIISCNSC